LFNHRTKMRTVQESRHPTWNKRIPIYMYSVRTIFSQNIHASQYFWSRLVVTNNILQVQSRSCTGDFKSSSWQAGTGTSCPQSDQKFAPNF